MGRAWAPQRGWSWQISLTWNFLLFSETVPHGYLFLMTPAHSTAVVPVIQLSRVLNLLAGGITVLNLSKIKFSTKFSNLESLPATFSTHTRSTTAELSGAWHVTWLHFKMLMRHDLFETYAYYVLQYIATL